MIAAAKGSRQYHLSRLYLNGDNALSIPGHKVSEILSSANITLDKETAVSVWTLIDRFLYHNCFSNFGYFNKLIPKPHWSI